MSTEIVISLGIAISSMIVSILSFSYTKQKDLESKYQTLDSCIDNLRTYVDSQLMQTKERLTSVEQKVEVWWRLMEKEMISLVKHPTEQEFDHLLDKFESKSITTNELLQLNTIIESKLSESIRGKEYGKTIALTFLKISISNRIKDIGDIA